MSTHAIATDSAPPLLGGKTHFYLRRLHSLTGIMFGGYILVHLTINATLVEGARHTGQPTVFQEQVDKIHSLPFLTVIEWAMIFLPLIFHTAYGLYVSFNGRQNVGNYGYGKNWYYLAQRVSAIVIFLFAIFHILSLKYGLFGTTLAFEPGNATNSTIRHIQSNALIGWVIYPIGVIASTFHLANGFWTGAISWGLTVSKQAQQRWGYVCAAIFLGATMAGMTALVAGLVHKPSDSATVETSVQVERMAPALSR